MATSGLKTLIISFLLVGLLLYALISFGVQFQTDMEANETILNEKILNNTYGGLRVNLTSGEDTANASRTNFEREEAKAEFGSLTLSSVVGVAKSFTGTMTSFFNVFFGLLVVVLLSKEFLIVTGTLAAILLITVIFLGWRWIRTGS